MVVGQVDVGSLVHPNACLKPNVHVVEVPCPH